MKEYANVYGQIMKEDKIMKQKVKDTIKNEVLVKIPKNSIKWFNQHKSWQKILDKNQIKIFVYHVKMEDIAIQVVITHVFFFSLDPALHLILWLLLIR
jgi:hypothetical protein